MSGVHSPLLAAGHAIEAPVALLPYQQAWIADDSPLKVCEKSRRIGMTWAEAADNVLIAGAAKPAGQNVYYLGTDKDMTEEYIDACAMWARAFSRAASEIEQGTTLVDDEDVLTYTIRFPDSGHRIVAMASVPAKLRGRQGILVGDEAAFQRDLPALLKSAVAFLLWGGKVRILSTHNGADSPFAELIDEVRSGRRKGTVHRTTFREAVADGLYRRVCLRRGIEWSAAGEAEWVADAYAYYRTDADEELDVIPSQSGGAYLSIAVIEARMADATPLVRGRWQPQFALAPMHQREAEVAAWIDEHITPVLDALPEGLRIAIGEDFGRVADLTVIWLLAEHLGLRQQTRLVIELGDCPYEQQRQILHAICDHLRDRGQLGRVLLDATGNGGYLAEVTQQRYGATRVEPITLSEGYYREEMPRLRAALEDGVITDLPRDRDIRDDLRAIRVIGGTPKLPPTRTTSSGDGPKQQRHGDAAVALLLAYAAARTPPPDMDWLPGPGRASRAERSFGGRGGDRPDHRDDLRVPATDGAW